MLARMGRPEEAMPWLAKAMPEADARYNLAQMMRHIGQADASQQQMDLALQADPNHIATLKLMSEGHAPPAAETVSTVSYRPEEPAAPPAAPAPVATLPTRPAETRPAETRPPEARPVEARPTETRPLMPLIPVVSDSWDTRPTPPNLTSPLPPARSEPKPRPNVTLGFETNP